MHIDVFNRLNNFKIKKSQEAFQDLALAIKILFRKEEKVYQSYKHPDYDLHVKTHKEFERGLASFEQSWFIDKPRRKDLKIQDVLDYIEQWTDLHETIDNSSMRPYMRITDFIAERQIA
jgi:hemerythrin